MSEKTKALLTFAVTAVLAVIAVFMVMHMSRADDAIFATDETIDANIERLQYMAEEPETTPPPEPLAASEVHILPTEDEALLAKIMQEEDGVGWPDAMIMCIGEVVLNRVASPEYPDTIREVLYEVDYDAAGNKYIQYAPVHRSSWERIAPEEHYVELARRLLAGERVLNNPQIVYQALFEQGRGTVVTYHDFYLGSTTYFCLTDMPGLYA